jgi:hypothetical protein
MFLSVVYSWHKILLHCDDYLPSLSPDSGKMHCCAYSNPCCWPLLACLAASTISEDRSSANTSS